MQEIGQHIQSSAVRHAHDELQHAEVGRIFQNGIEREHEGFSALEGEAFLADILRVDKGLEGLGLVDFAKNIAVHLGGIPVGAATVFDAACHPLADFGIFNMGKLDTERVGVGLAQGGDHFAQRHLAAMLEMTR